MKALRNDQDSFSCICGPFTFPSQRTSIVDVSKIAFLVYYDALLASRDESRAPHKVCDFCDTRLHQLTKGKPKVVFNSVKISGYSATNRHRTVYPNVPSTILLIPHSNGLQ